MKCLSNREVKSLNARIEKFDLEGSIRDWTVLPDELIEVRLMGASSVLLGDSSQTIVMVRNA
ncbi:MAG: hypothetical protein ABSA57_19840 [Candidatus Acidiferrales bacterium]|jgi:hypothetical protein